MTASTDEDVVLSADLFADFRSPSTTPPPVPSWSGESEEEMLQQHPENEFYRVICEIRAETRARNQKEAEALGFSSWEAQKNHDKEESRKWLEEYVKEHGQSPSPRGGTEEEKTALELNYRRHLVHVHELLNPCDCVEHIHPRFCLQRLVSYESQGGDPSDFNFLQSLHPTDLNVHIQEDDPSNRIPDWGLEDAWDIPTQSRVLSLPQWAKRYDIIQRMSYGEEMNEIEYHGDRGQEKNHPPRSRTVSLSPDSGVEENAERLPPLKYQGKREDSAALLNPRQASPRSPTKAIKAHASFPVEFKTSPSESQRHSAAGPPTQPTRRDRSRQASGMRMAHSMRASQAQMSRIKKRHVVKKEATGEAPLSDRIQTHTQDVLNLVALDSSSCASNVPPN